MFRLRMFRENAKKSSDIFYENCHSFLFLFLQMSLAWMDYPLRRMRRAMFERLSAPRDSGLNPPRIFLYGLQVVSSGLAACLCEL